MQKNGASWLKFKNEHIWEIVTMTSYINPFVVSVFCKEISSFLEVIISQLNCTTAVIWSVWLSNATKNLRHRVHSWFVPWIRIQGTNRLCVRRKQHCLGKQSYSIHCNTIILHRNDLTRKHLVAILHHNPVTAISLRASLSSRVYHGFLIWDSSVIISINIIFCTEPLFTVLDLGGCRSFSCNCLLHLEKRLLVCWEER